VSRYEADSTTGIGDAFVGSLLIHITKEDSMFRVRSIDLDLSRMENLLLCVLLIMPYSFLPVEERGEASRGARVLQQGANHGLVTKHREVAPKGVLLVQLVEETIIIRMLLDRCLWICSDVAIAALFGIEFHMWET
jgi:hypothetical protein